MLLKLKHNDYGMRTYVLANSDPFQVYIGRHEDYAIVLRVVAVQLYATYAISMVGQQIQLKARFSGFSFGFRGIIIPRKVTYRLFKK
jgi:stringent starvation protein B